MLSDEIFDHDDDDVNKKLIFIIVLGNQNLVNNRCIADFRKMLFLLGNLTAYSYRMHFMSCTLACNACWFKWLDWPIGCL